MSKRKANKHTFPTYFIRTICFLAICTVAGCIEVKNIPASGVYTRSNEVEITNNTSISREMENDTEELLSQYVDDSIKTASTGFFGLYKKIIASGSFDTAYLTNSNRFFKSYLNSEGFYNARVDSVSTKFDTVLRKTSLFGKEKRVVEVRNQFFINLGPPLRIDTSFNDFRDSILQAIANGAKKGSLLQQGNRYKKGDVAAEMDRISGIFRNNGYLRMSRSALLTEADTTDPALVSNQVLDPLESILAAQRRLENPTVKLRLFERPGAPQDAFQTYHIDSVFIYPDTRLIDNPDSVMRKNFAYKDSQETSPIYVLENDKRFVGKVVRRQNFLYPGSLYKDSAYFRTINNYSGLGPWQQLDVRTTTSFRDSVNLVNFHLFLIPAKRKSLQFDLEGSQNNNISVSNALAGRFLALSFNVSHRDRNAFRRAIQSNTIIRSGFELNNSRDSVNSGLFQTFLVNLNHSYTFPQLIFPFSLIDKKRFLLSRTKLSVDALYTDRIDFFKQTSFGARLQYTWRKKVNTHTVTIPNFETVYLDPTDSLLRVIAQNPSLLLSFRQGTIFSTGYTFFRPISYANSKHSSLLRLNGEVTFPGPELLFDRAYFQFFKIDGQFQHEIKTSLTNSWNFRLFGGVGWEFASFNRLQRTLPYYRQFVSGGANSMRAWPLRQLGLGSSIVSDTSIFTDRFGDIQFELNAEYRFKLFKLFGYYINGVGFADIGNVWNHFDNTDGEGEFRLNRLYEDLAVAAGTGLRFDLDFLILRLDFGIKLKDPVREGAGWMRDFTWKGSNRIPGSAQKPNYALQFGVGYPF